jgi:putative molybdopterin biosynthesis protein
VQQGTADVTLGLHAAATQLELDFIPLFHERYDLIIPQEQLARLMPLLETIQTGVFRRSVDALTGYETTHTGEQIPL